MKSFLACLAIVVFSASVVLAQAQEVSVPDLETPASAPSPEAMVADLLIVRPIALAALVIGAAVSLVAMPLAMASCTTCPVYERLVVEPYTFAICRPLGDFK